MKYCVEYRKDFPYLQEINELNIHFRRKDATLLDFLLLYQEKTINIIVDDEKDFIENNDFEIFDKILIEHPELHNFRFLLHSYTNLAVQDFLQAMDVRKIQYKYFFNDFVRDWDTLKGYVDLDPCAIYIVENLCFEIKRVANLLHSRGIEVRCFPNVGQTSWKYAPDLKKFFIRPEDIQWYEPYVDVCELFGKIEEVPIYYKIYAIDKQWFGQLNEIIISFNDNDLDSRFLLPHFGIRRLNCGKVCSKGRGCQICDASKVLSATLRNNGLFPSIEEDDEDIINEENEEDFDIDALIAELDDDNTLNEVFN